MSDWSGAITYLLYEFQGAIKDSPEILIVFLPMFIFIELPLFILVMTGVMKWLSREQYKNSNLDCIKTPKVSCIVTCYAEGEAVCKTLMSLAEQLYPGYIEIIAVIDGADENKPTHNAVLNCIESMGNYKRRCFIVVPKKKRGGRVSTLNTGLHLSRGEIIINADADTSFDNTMVSEIVKCFENESVPAVGGALRVRNSDSGILAKMQSIEYVIAMHCNKTGLSEWNLLNNISGAFGAFRRDFLNNIGGWDTHTAEDLDLTIRIKNYLKRHQGLEIAFCPKAIGYTDVPSTMFTLCLQRLRWDGDLFFIYMRKHLMSLTPNLLGWKTFLYTMVFGVGQNVILPVMSLIFIWWLIFSYPLQFVVTLFFVLYMFYLIVNILNLFVFYIAISEKVKEDMALLPWIFIYPLYTFVLRLWSVVGLINEMLRRSHEESSMAPWWVIKRGGKF